MKNKWFSESFAIMMTNKFILKNAYQVIEEKLPLIQFYYLTPFTDPIYLQIILHKENISIIKSTLQKAQEKKKIDIQSGNLAGTTANKLTELIESLHVNSFGLEEELLSGRDGYYAELTISRRFHSTTFSWFQVFAPDEWEVLNPVVEVLLGLNDSVRFEEDSSINVQILLEEDNDSVVISGRKSMLLEYNDVENDENKNE